MTDKFRGVKVTNFTCNGECSNCGQCCGDILHLSKQEIKVIDEYLKKHKIEATPRCIMMDYDNTCPFRDNKEMKCKIYEVRPEICRAYKCDRSAKEVWEKRELTNKGKLPRSMRNLFFGDTKGAEWILKIMGMPVFDRKDKMIIGGNNEKN